MIENLSQTASWVAYCRALETERPDALFKDPFARRLAGTLGERLVRQLGQAELVHRGIAVRTAVFDEFVIDCISTRSVDLVLNLGAGLDTRPWRLPMPSAVQWVDVDLRAILEHKREILRGEPLKCEYRAVPADLADANAYDAIFRQIDLERRCVLVITEGLLIYLKTAQVAALARTLHRNESFRWWLTDITSPRALAVLKDVWAPVFAHGRATFQFAPADSTAFFDSLGWREDAFRSALEEAQRLRRQAPSTWLSRALLWLSSPSQREEFRRVAGTALMRRE